MTTLTQLRRENQRLRRALRCLLRALVGATGSERVVIGPAEEDEQAWMVWVIQRDDK